MQIDIRNGESEEITEIVFHGPDCDEDDAVKIDLGGRYTSIDSSDGGNRVYIDSEEHAVNLIKALKKAISLGTWSE